MKLPFCKTGELNSSSYVKVPLRSNAILKIENNDSSCFLSSISTYLHPCENSHPSRVRNYKQYFIELNIDGFGVTNGFKCSDVHKSDEVNNLSVNISELFLFSIKMMVNGDII